MLTAIFLGLSGIAVVYIAVGVAFLSFTGKLIWTPAISRSAKLGWPVIVAISACISVVLLGPSILITAWLYFACAIVLPFVLFLLLDLTGGHGPFTQHKGSTEPRTPNWDAMWRSYEGKPVPPWMMQAATQGEVRYDGKVARIVNGVLVPTTTPTSLNIERLFKRLDDLLG